jgi:hypothetical protein
MGVYNFIGRHSQVEAQNDYTGCHKWKTNICEMLSPRKLTLFEADAVEPLKSLHLLVQFMLVRGYN